jgi:LacI family transcriptional regulator
MPEQRGVALLIEMSNAHSRGILHGIRSYIREHEPWMIRFSEQGRGSVAPRWLGRWQGDGIIARITDTRIAAAVAQKRLPVVDVGNVGLAPLLPSVETDNEAIARLAAEHLLGRGLKHFGYCGVAGILTSTIRGDHFAHCLAEAGHECSLYQPAGRSGRADPWQSDSTGIAHWIRGLTKPAGVLAAWDGCAVQILQVCRRIGVAVPDELAVLGVDNDELLCDLADPPLSSVATGMQDIGYRAAELLDRMMAGEPVSPGVHRIRPLGVVTRQSTDMLAIDDRQVSQALQFIRERACHAIGVEDVLAMVPLTRRVLEGRFKRLLGRTPHEEIVRTQLRRVEELLVETDLPLKAIASRAGFQHVQYMISVFKKKIGVTPGEYRTRNRPLPAKARR